ncbi:MAG: polysaccharide biosynthesis C-terminal domain-containing protein [Spirochaetia bacterium]|jgi:putative peptidoglycan lipid II flippase|nr:polysaccharide biosynthesis C-terminal domain-containing protein [Spirochaetia bacterium]
MQKKTNKLFLILPLLVISGKLLGFAKQIVLANYLGTNLLADIYQILENIYSLISNSYSIGFSTILLSSYVFYKNKEKHEDLEYISCFNSVGLIISFVLSGIFFFIAIFLKLHFDSSEQLRYFLFYSLLCYSGCFLITYLARMGYGVLEINNDFTTEKLSGIFVSLFVIFFTVVFFKKFEILSIIFGELFAWSAYFIFILVRLKNNRYLLRFIQPKISIKVRKSIKNTLPLIFSYALNSINNLIDKLFAGQITVGGPAAIQYAHVVCFDLVLNVFISSFDSLFISDFSQCFAELDGEEQVQKKLCFRITLLTCIIIPLSIFYMLYSKQIIGLLLGRGAFDTNSINLTSKLVSGYALGILFLPLQRLLMLVFYAKQDTQRVTINSVIGVCANIVFNFIFYRRLGLFGLAVGTTLSIIIVAWLHLIFLNRTYFNFTFISVLFKSSYLKFFFCGLITFVINKFFVSFFLSYGSLLGMVFGMILIICLYSGCCILFKCKFSQKNITLACVLKRIKSFLPF